jgi:hypothetical protein
MKPSPDVVVRRVAGKLSREILMSLPSGYDQSSAAASATLLLFAGIEMDRAVDLAVRENAAIRALFATPPNSLPAAFALRLGSAAEQKEPDLRLSTVEAANTSLKALLIELHEWSEEARELTLERRILELLREFATARMIVLPGRG